MSKNNKPTLPQKKKKINLVTGKQRRENSKNSKPSVSNIKTKSTPNPRGNFSNNKFTVRRREYVSDVVPTSGFSPRKIEINPALPESFPWLSGIASSFQKYKIKKFRVIYETSQSTLVPGVLAIAPEFNVTEPLPDSKLRFFAYQNLTRSAIWQSFSVDIPLKDIMNYKDYYIRNDDLSNLILYDPFYLIICSFDTTQDNSLGEIWFEYEIEFSIPQPAQIYGLEDLKYKFFVLTGDFTDEKYFGTSQTSKGLLNVVIDQVNQVITFKEKFVGQMHIISYDEYGNSNDMTVNKGVLNSSSSLEPIMTGAVGGSGYNQNENDFYRMYDYDLSMKKGDYLTFEDYFAYNRPTNLVIDFYNTGIYEPIN